MGFVLQLVHVPALRDTCCIMMSAESLATIQCSVDITPNVVAKVFVFVKMGFIRILEQIVFRNVERHLAHAVSMPFASMDYVHVLADSSIQQLMARTARFPVPAPGTVGLWKCVLTTRVYAQVAMVILRLLHASWLVTTLLLAASIRRVKMAIVLAHPHPCHH